MEGERQEERSKKRDRKAKKKRKEKRKKREKRDKVLVVDDIFRSRAFRNKSVEIFTKEK